MKYSPVFLALISMAYGLDINSVVSAASTIEASAPTSSEVPLGMPQFNASMPVDVSNGPFAFIQTTVKDASQFAGNLYGELKHAQDNNKVSPELLSSYITGVDAAIDSVVNGINFSLADYSQGVSQVISRFLLGPFMDTLNSNAKDVVAAIGDGKQLEPNVLAGFLVHYEKIAGFAEDNQVDASAVREAIDEISKTSGSSPALFVRDPLGGIKGAIESFHTHMDNMFDTINNHPGHANAAVLTGLITGLDGQIDNLAGDVFNGLNTVTLGLTSGLGDFLLGPVFQSATDGIQVLIGNVLGGSVDFVEDHISSMFTSSMNKLMNIGSALKVSEKNMKLLSDSKKQWTSLQETMDSKKSGKSISTSSAEASAEATGLAKRDPLGGIKGAIESFHTHMDNMFDTINNHPGHANAAVLTGLITGLDGQIDNLAGDVFNGLNKVTLGLTSGLGDFLLGPVFQSATDGIQVLIGNVLGGSVDFVEDHISSMFTSSISKLEGIGSALKVSEKNMKLLSDSKKQWTSLQETMDSKKSTKSITSASAEATGLAKRDPLGGIKGAIESFHTHMDNMFDTINNHPGHANAAVLTGLITGLDGQIDNLAGDVFNGLNKVTLGLTSGLGDFLLGPVFQSATDGIQVLIGNVLGGSVDFVEDHISSMFTSSISKLEGIGSALKVSEKNMKLLSDSKKQWTSLQETMDSKKSGKSISTSSAEASAEATGLAKRDPLGGIKGAIESFHTHMDNMFDTINNHPGHANAAVLTGLITGLDGQIDNLAGDVFNGLNKVTLGLTSGLDDFLLGPVFQSATDGIQVLIGNVLGGSVDFVEDHISSMFTSSISKLEGIGSALKVSEKNMKLLSDSKKQWTSLQVTMDSKKSTKSITSASAEATGLAKRDPLGGIKGAIESFHTHMDNMFDTINNHPGHASAAVLTGLITGLDGQIDNLAGDVFNALNTATLGLTSGLGDFLLGPVFQSATDGVQVLIGNVLGGSVDFVEDHVSSVLTSSINKLMNIGSALKVGEKNMKLLSDSKKQWTSLQETMDSKKSTKNIASASAEATGLAKRDPLGGIKGAAESFHTHMDNMFDTINNYPGHATAAILTGLITGLDGQIDNFAGTLFNDLNGVTLGLSGDLGDFLLGPIFQSATDGIQVLIGNVLGGSVDFVEDHIANLFTSSINKLQAIGTKMKVSEKNMKLLADSKKQWVSLQTSMDGKRGTRTTSSELNVAPATHAAKRDVTGDLKGALNAFQQGTTDIFNKVNNETHMSATSLEDSLKNAITVLNSFTASILGHSDKSGGNQLNELVAAPAYQATVNGVQGIIGNVLNGNFGMVNNALATDFSAALQKLQQVGAKLNVGSKNLQQLANVQRQWTSLNSSLNRK